MKPNWIGRSFENIMDNGDKCIALMGQHSLVYTPVKIMPNTTYKVEFLAKKESGNGIFFANLYGGPKFDFQQNEITCGNQWANFEIEMKSGQYPATQPMAFRIWKNQKGTGTTLIKSIRVSFLESKLKVIDIEPKPLSRKYDPPIIKNPPEVAQLRIAKRLKEVVRNNPISAITSGPFPKIESQKKKNRKPKNRKPNK